MRVRCRCAGVREAGVVAKGHGARSCSGRDAGEGERAAGDVGGGVRVRGCGFPCQVGREIGHGRLGDACCWGIAAGRAGQAGGDRACAEIPAGVPRYDGAGRICVGGCSAGVG